MEAIRAEEISQIISSQIKEYEKKLDISETGTVLSVGDGIARIYGLQQRHGRRAARIPRRHLGHGPQPRRGQRRRRHLGEDILIKEGDIVKRTGRIARFPWATASSAAWSTPWASRIDGKGPISRQEFRRIEIGRPGRRRAPARQGAPADRASRPSTP